MYMLKTRGYIYTYVLLCRNIINGERTEERGSSCGYYEGRVDTLRKARGLSDKEGELAEEGRKKRRKEGRKGGEVGGRRCCYINCT
jgi:hypothetical protein